MTSQPEFEIQVVLYDTHGQNPSRTIYVDTLSPRDIARLIGDYTHAIYAMPDEVTVTVRCTHKSRHTTPHNRYEP